MQGMLEGFEEFDAAMTGMQEKTTKELIAHFIQDKKLTPEATYICKSMLSIARNIDMQNQKGREISRNMTSLLTWFQELKQLYPDEPQMDEDVQSFLAEARA